MSRKEFLRWEKLRLKGKRYVVLRTAVVSSFFFFLSLNLISWLWNGRSLPQAYFFAYLVLGLAVGFAHWWVNEGRFQNFLLNKKMSASFRP